jgi:YidC/Oxa1 family membrane protein insertase
MYKSYLSTAKMRVLKPEVDALNEKFPKTEDAMKKQQAVMALYKKAGASPLGGCLPMLVQMPILIAMYRFFPSSIELRQESFLWATDLSSYDSIYDFPNGFSIPFYGDHVSLFTLLMTIATLLSVKMNSEMTGGGQMQMPQMKMMMYIMPIMFLGFFNDFASALSYYYFVATMVTFGQQFLMRKFVNEDEILRKIEENKKKPPPKKSKFQKRLEQKMKEQGYNK